MEEQQEYREKVISAIANLATATAANRATMASLTETINNLTIELRNTQSKLVAALEKKATLAARKENVNLRHTNDNKTTDT